MDIKLIACAICFGCGLYELQLAVGPDGHGWQFLAGIAFIVFGVVRGVYLFREIVRGAEVQEDSRETDTK